MSLPGVIAFVVAKGGDESDAVLVMEYLNRREISHEVPDVWRDMHEAWDWVRVRKSIELEVPDGQ